LALATVFLALATVFLALATVFLALATVLSQEPWLAPKRLTLKLNSDKPLIFR